MLKVLLGLTARRAQDAKSAKKRPMGEKRGLVGFQKEGFVLPT
jgi:hypothetical protein